MSDCPIASTTQYAAYFVCNVIVVYYKALRSGLFKSVTAGSATIILT